jgi:hypothetical protein
MANVGRTYLRGISRLGSAATSRIGQASSVSRMGELAAEGASKVAEVATAVPQSISRCQFHKHFKNFQTARFFYVKNYTLSMINSQMFINKDFFPTLYNYKETKIASFRLKNTRFVAIFEFKILRV